MQAEKESLVKEGHTPRSDLPHSGLFEVPAESRGSNRLNSEVYSTENQDNEDQKESEHGEVDKDDCSVDKSRKTAPKRPLSPFIFYSQEARRRIKLEHPQLHSKEIMKQVQKSWRAM